MSLSDVYEVMVFDETISYISGSKYQLDRGRSFPCIIISTLKKLKIIAFKNNKIPVYLDAIKIII